MALLLSENDVRNLLTMPLALEAVETSFRRLAAGAAHLHPRHRLQVPKKTYLHYMAAADGESGYMGMKIYTSSKSGLRFLVPLFSAESGDLLAMIEADYLGQVRTGAASGIATKWMAREDAKTIGIAGTGLQARTQLEAIALVRKIERIRAFGRDSERRAEFSRQMTDKLRVTVEPVATAEEAVHGADIIVTATNASVPVVEGRWLAPGTHINAIGANFPQKRELDSDAVLRAVVIAADSIEQSKEEAGDLIQAFGTDAERWKTVRELGEIVAGKIRGRTDQSQITLFKSNGIATEDIAVAGKLFEMAREKGIGREIKLWEEESRAAEGRGA
ncbi:MAG TPA: ornithine cyclodeaminase family protein [Candidatus Acidoferrum sp.]|nr:ornithine cyclodeaminase family protein [Candidatus Acidoferrum sp.]